MLSPCHEVVAQSKKNTNLENKKRASERKWIRKTSANRGRCESRNADKKCGDVLSALPGNYTVQCRAILRCRCIGVVHCERVLSRAIEFPSFISRCNFPGYVTASRSSLLKLRRRLAVKHHRGVKRCCVGITSSSIYFG